MSALESHIGHELAKGIEVFIGICGGDVAVQDAKNRVNRYNPEIHHRRSIRLKGYDYSHAGAYFITICVHNRQCLFGEIDDSEMVLNELGGIVRDEWLKSTEIRSEIQLGEYVIMPNHFHGIVIFNENIERTVVGAIHELPLHHCPQHHESPPRRQQR